MNAQLRELIEAARDVERRAGPDREPRLRAALDAALAAPKEAGDDWRISAFDRWNDYAKEIGYTGLMEALGSTPLRLAAPSKEAGPNWRELLDSVVSQFSDTGCTCTFQDDSCCAYARAVAALEKSA